MRYGGDEFLIISRYDLIPKIKAGLRAIKKRSTQPYDLHLSMGSICVSKNDGYTLDEAVKRTDEAMYEIKRSYKSQQGAMA